MGVALRFLDRWRGREVAYCAFAKPAKGVLVLRAIRAFFGFDTGEDEDLEAPLGRRPELPPTAFRVGERLTIKGEIAGEGDLDLAGRFEGTINVQGTVVIGDRAEVDADITASTIVVGGKVRGNLNASGRVEILPQGVLTGNLKTGSFTAADGASVKGEILVERGVKPRAEVTGAP